MAWIPIRGAVRRLRLARKLDVKQLAKLTKTANDPPLSVRTIELLESRNAPVTMNVDTVRRLAHGLSCEHEAIAKWDPRARVKIRDADDDPDPAGMPAPSTLAQHAERELEMAAQSTITVGSADYELLGAQLFSRCRTACAAYKDKAYAVAGRIKEHGPLPQRACTVLKTETGHGARFLLTRKVGKGLPFYTTVFTRTLKHTTQLLDYAEAKKPATVITRVMIEPPTETWKGFFFFQKKGEKPTPFPFAFVVENIVNG